MNATNAKLTAAVETYLADLGRIRVSGGETGERSSYGPLANLLNAVGATLRPKVFCVGELADHGILPTPRCDSGSNVCAGRQVTSPRSFVRPTN